MATESAPPETAQTSFVPRGTRCRATSWTLRWKVRSSTNAPTDTITHGSVGYAENSNSGAAVLFYANGLGESLVAHYARSREIEFV